MGPCGVTRRPQQGKYGREVSPVTRRRRAQAEPAGRWCRGADVGPWGCNPLAERQRIYTNKLAMVSLGTGGVLPLDGGQKCLWPNLSYAQGGFSHRSLMYSHS